MKWLRTIIALLFAVAIGCGGDTDETSPEPVDPDAIPADEVRVLDEGARQSLNSFDFDVEENEGTLRFDAESPFATQIADGQILASRPAGDVAPSGLLQRVQSVTTQGDEVVVITRQATLAETFERAEFDERRNLDADDIQTMEPLAEGVTIEPLDSGLRTQRSRVGQPFQLNFSQVLVDTDGDRDTTNDQIELNGDVTFGASFDAALKVGGFKLQRFLFAVNVDESINLEIEGDLDQADIEERKQVARINLNTIVFQVGPVPVVIKIDLVVSVGVDGTLTADIYTSASQSTSLRLGAEYTDDDGWSEINETSSNFEFQPPQFNLTSVNARGYVRPQVEIKLYGVAGPFVFAEPYVRFVAELYTNPYWELYGGLEFGIGFVVTVPVLGEVASWEASVPAFEEEIGESSNRAPTLEIISPDDGTTVTAGSDLNMMVSATDREQSTVRIIADDGTDSEVVTSTEGEEVELEFTSLCQGARTYTITAEDDEGATDVVQFSVVVENAVPEVELDPSTLTGANAPPIFPGGYMSAAATVNDPGCPSADPVNTDFIEWYIDGMQVSQAPELLTRLAPQEYSVGQTISLEARYDDGEDTGVSQPVDVTLESTPPGDLEAEVKITQCDFCGESVIFAGSLYVPDEVTLRGVAFDPKEGQLPGSELTWQIINEDDSARKTIGTGREITFKFSDYYPNPGSFEGTNTIYLTVDDAGQTVEDSVDFFFLIGG